MFQRLFFVSLLIFLVKAGTPSVSLTNATEKAVIEFIDFDKTFIESSMGEDALIDCQNFTFPCNGSGELVAALRTWSNSTIIDYFGDESRRDRLHSHFNKQNNVDVDLYVLSTSWEPVPAEEWGDFIYDALQIAGYSSDFPRDKILTLDDPGPG